MGIKEPCGHGLHKGLLIIIIPIVIFMADFILGKKPKKFVLKVGDYQQNEILKSFSIIFLMEPILF